MFPRSTSGFTTPSVPSSLRRNSRSPSQNSPCSVRVVDDTTLEGRDAVVTFEHREAFLDLAWVHSIQAGIDRFPLEAFADNRVVLIDVFETESLPENSPLWDFEHVIITPHAAALTRDYYRAIDGLIRENVSRLEAGEAFHNRVV